MKNERISNEETIKDNVLNYYIDFIPQRKNEKRYREVSEFFLLHYLELYEDKMIRILLKLMICYNLRIYLTDFPVELESNKSKEYSHLVGTDLSTLDIDEWVPVIKHVIEEEISSIQILSINPRFLISINSGFSNELRRIPKNQIKLLKSIVESEGLFLIQLDQ